MIIVKMRVLLKFIFSGLKISIFFGFMVNVVGGVLVGKVLKVGGLGFIGVGYYIVEKMWDELNKVMNILDV